MGGEPPTSPCGRKLFPFQWFDRNPGTLTCDKVHVSPYYGRGLAKVFARRESPKRFSSPFPSLLLSQASPICIRHAGPFSASPLRDFRQRFPFVLALFGQQDRIIPGSRGIQNAPLPLHPFDLRAARFGSWRLCWLFADFSDFLPFFPSFANRGLLPFCSFKGQYFMFFFPVSFLFLPPSISFSTVPLSVFPHVSPCFTL